MNLFFTLDILDTILQIIVPIFTIAAFLSSLFSVYYKKRKYFGKISQNYQLSILVVIFKLSYFNTCPEARELLKKYIAKIYGNDKINFIYNNLFSQKKYLYNRYEIEKNSSFYLNSSVRHQLIINVLNLVWINRKSSKHQLDDIKELALSIGISKSKYNLLYDKYMRKRFGDDYKESYKKGHSQNTQQQQSQGNNYQRKQTYTKPAYTYSRKKNALKILGLSENSSITEIKRAYRNLVKIYHPDRNLNKSEKEREAVSFKFREITEAYDYLCDVVKI